MDSGGKTGLDECSVSSLGDGIWLFFGIQTVCCNWILLTPPDWRWPLGRQCLLSLLCQWAHFSLCCLGVSPSRFTMTEGFCLLSLKHVSNLKYYRSPNLTLKILSVKAAPQSLRDLQLRYPVLSMPYFAKYIEIRLCISNRPHKHLISWCRR